MTLNELNDLIQCGESVQLEFKKSTAQLAEAAKTLCAFLNGNGGTVLIGVSDKKNLVGLDVTDATKLEIANTLRKFEPTANIDIQYCLTPSGKQVVSLKACPDYRSIPYAFDGKAYERKESSTNVMPQAKYQQLLLSKHLNPVSWESQLALNVTIQDLDYQEIFDAHRAVSSQSKSAMAFQTEDATEVVRRLKLLEVGSLTNAAVVLFAKDIPGNYFQCVLRMARFRGTQKSDFIDNKRVFGNAFHLLREAEAFIARNTATSSHFEQGSFARVDEPEYPFIAVREALINAICHRDYASLSGGITLLIYDDRLEIINTGTLSHSLTVDDLKKSHTSHPRNPIILNAFFRRGFIESLGIGTQQIISACVKAGMKEPEFYEESGTFVVKLWSNHHLATAVPSSLDMTLSQRQRNILNIFKPGHMLSPQEILTQLNDTITDRTLRNDLQHLKEKHYLSTEGKGPKTRWFLTEDPEVTRK